MALKPQALGKLFGSLNKGKKTLSTLSASQLKEVEAARKVFSRGGFKSNTQAHKFFTNEAAEQVSKVDGAIGRAAKEELRSENLAKKIEARAAQQEAARSKQIAQQAKDVDDIFTQAGENISGFDRSEIDQAISSIREEKLNPYSMSDTDIQDAIQERIYSARSSQQPRVGGQPNVSETVAENIAPPSSTVDRYMTQRYSTMVDDIESALNSGQSLNSDVINAFSNQTRLGDNVSNQFKEMVEGGKNAEALSLLRGQERNYVNSAGLVDKMQAHRVPQKAAVGVGAAWLVSNMAGSKGRQSNSELYGQQTPYQ